MQKKINVIADNLARMGLTINRGKSKVFKIKASNNTPNTAQDEALEKIEIFTYLGSIIDHHGGTDVENHHHHHQ
ncbi:hypothetical protein BgiBS90_009701 [Biomphalaria glabrata]|nr:hypothetical protein BgiBS90_009701 [Biomphalaria glabrata]